MAILHRYLTGNIKVLEALLSMLSTFSVRTSAAFKDTAVYSFIVQEAQTPPNFVFGFYSP